MEQKVFTPKGRDGGGCETGGGGRGPSTDDRHPSSEDYQEEAPTEVNVEGQQGRVVSCKVDLPTSPVGTHCYGQPCSVSISIHGFYDVTLRQGREGGGPG